MYIHIFAGDRFYIPNSLVNVLVFATWYSLIIFGNCRLILRTDRLYVEKVICSERNFLKLFSENKKCFIDPLPKEVQSRLEAFLRAYDEVFKLHTRLFEMLTVDCEDLESLCALFMDYLKVSANYNIIVNTNFKCQSIDCRRAT